MTQKIKGLMFITARRKWRPETIYPGRCLGVRQRGHRMRAADLKNGGPRYPTFHTGRQFEKGSFLNEQSWNVIENKGPLWKTGCEAGML
jgi:hypothetical protein